MRQQRKRRIDQALRQPVAGQHRSAGSGAASDRLGQHAPQQAGRRFRHPGIERRHRERLPQAAEQHAIGRQHRRDRVLRRGAPQPQRFEIIARSGPRDPPRRAQHPPRDNALSGSHRPPLTGRDIDERDRRLGGPLERIERPDALDIGRRRLVAREEQVIAVVDANAQFGIDKGAAASAGLLTRLVEDDRVALIGQRDGGCQTGETGPDDVHAARRRGDGDHTSPWRRTSHSFCPFDRLTRRAGSRHPERSNASSIAR